MKNNCHDTQLSQLQGCSGSYKTIVRQCPASDEKLLKVFNSTVTMAASPNSFPFSVLTSRPTKSHKQFCSWVFR